MTAVCVYVSTVCRRESAFFLVVFLCRQSVAYRSGREADAEHGTKSFL